MLYGCKTTKRFSALTLTSQSLQNNIGLSVINTDFPNSGNMDLGDYTLIPLL